LKAIITFDFQALIALIERSVKCENQVSSIVVQPAPPHLGVVQVVGAQQVEIESYY
jgi:hypothetical protein